MSSGLLQMFVESTGVACSDSVSHNRVQALSIPVLLLACRTHNVTVIGVSFLKFYGDNHLEVPGSISPTGNNRKYILLLNTCTQSWLTELKLSTLVNLIKGSVLSSA